METLPAQRPKATDLEELRELRDATPDPELKRIIRWSIKQIERPAPQVDELKQLEVRNAKYDYYAKLAKTFATSQMVDKDLGEADLFFVIEMGDSVGLSAPQAIQSIASINGKPSLWGDGLMAVVRNSKECEYIREEQTGSIDEGDAVAVCITKRRGEPDEVARTFSLDDATRAGLYPSDKKTPWKTYPMRMLQMRARAWCLRDVFADVLRGFSSAEEMQDIQYADYDEESRPETVITPKADVAGEVIDQTIEHESGNLDEWVQKLDGAENMETLLKMKGELKDLTWSDEERNKLNGRYRAGRNRIKKAQEKVDAEVQRNTEDGSGSDAGDGASPVEAEHE